ncbi:MAG TPA: hypothetical protein PK961_05625 [bacterium]|nr:hypothetical protein [bacterium]
MKKNIRKWSFCVAALKLFLALLAMLLVLPIGCSPQESTSDASTANNRRNKDAFFSEQEIDVPDECARTKNIAVAGKPVVKNGDSRLSFSINDPEIIYAVRLKLLVEGLASLCDEDNSLELISPAKQHYPIDQAQCRNLPNGIDIPLYTGEAAPGIWMINATNSKDLSAAITRAELTVTATYSTFAAPQGTVCFYPRFKNLMTARKGSLPDIGVYGRTAGSVTVSVSTIPADEPVKLTIQDPAGALHEIEVSSTKPAVIPAASSAAPTGVWKAANVQTQASYLNWRLQVDSAPQIALIDLGSWNQPGGEAAVKVKVPGDQFARARLVLRGTSGRGPIKARVGDESVTVVFNQMQGYLLPERLVAQAIAQQAEIVIDQAASGPGTGVASFQMRPVCNGAASLNLEGMGNSALVETSSFLEFFTDQESFNDSLATLVSTEMDGERPDLFSDGKANLDRILAQASGFQDLFSSPTFDGGLLGANKLATAFGEGADSLLDVFGGFTLAALTADGIGLSPRQDIYRILAGIGSGLKNAQITSGQSLIANANTHLAAMALPHRTSRIEMQSLKRKTCVGWAAEDAKSSDKLWPEAAIAQMSTLLSCMAMTAETSKMNSQADDYYFDESITMSGMKFIHRESSRATWITDENGTKIRYSISVSYSLDKAGNRSSWSIDYSYSQLGDNGKAILTVYDFYYYENLDGEPVEHTQHKIVYDENGKPISDLSCNMMDPNEQGKISCKQLVQQDSDQQCPPDIPSCTEQIVTQEEMEALEAQAKAMHFGSLVNCSGDTCNEGGPGRFITGNLLPYVYVFGTKDPWILCDSAGAGCSLQGAGNFTQSMCRLPNMQLAWTDPTPQ